jgi:hypothetical protein
LARRMAQKGARGKTFSVCGFFAHPLEIRAGSCVRQIGSLFTARAFCGACWRCSYNLSCILILLQNKSRRAMAARQFVGEE